MEQKKVRALILEDVPAEAELVLREFRKAGWTLDWQRVASEADFVAALDHPPEIILADYALPGFGVPGAMSVMRARGLDIPVIVVTGSIGDDAAAECMRLGVADYLLKDRLARLPDAVAQALQKKRMREEQDRADRARRESEEALEKSEYRLDLALGASGLAVWDYDFVAGDVRFSRHWWPILGYAPGEVPLRIEAWEKLTHPDDLVRLKATLAAHMKGVAPILDAEYRMLAKSGQWRWIRTVGRVVERDTGDRALRGTCTHGDVTLRKEQEERIARLTRIHQVLSGINSAIVRIRDRDELFKEACRIAAQQGGFGIAWISKFDPATMDVTPVAWAGIDTIGYEQLKTTARADVPLGHGVVGRAIRSKKPVACNDMAAEPDVGSEQRREALRRGYRSDVALPLFEEGTVAGTLTLYAKEPNFFTDDEIKLLSELAEL